MNMPVARINQQEKPPSVEYRGGVSILLPGSPDGGNVLHTHITDPRAERDCAEDPSARLPDLRAIIEKKD